MKKFIRVLSLIVLLFAFTVSVVSAQTRHHKKWSHRKKDAVIGTAGGAAAGALVSKDKSKGAIIGGVVGGAAGYLHGRHKDKKAGTINK
jgi:hypothetical protein